MIRVVKVIVHNVNLNEKTFLKLFLVEKCGWLSHFFFLIGKNFNDDITAERIQ